MTTIATPLRTRRVGHISSRLEARALSRQGFAVLVVLSEAILLVLSEARHKPWFDEAQAWLLARDTGPLDLLIHHLRYEGSPGLWHLLLMVPAKLGLPYGSMAVISIAAALAGSAILLLRSPLPRLIAVMVCFSFFTFFQYGVVARSYSLLAPLLFLIAAGWRTRLERPVRFFVLLALLANVSLHGSLIAISLAAIHTADVWRVWPSMAPRARRLHVKCTAAFGIVLATVVAELYPPRDLGGGGSWHLSPPWELFRSDLVTRQLPVVIVTLLVLSVSLWWFRLRRCLTVFLLPTGALTVLFSVRYFSPWHAGTIFLLWVFALWLSLDGQHRSQAVPSPRARAAILTAAGVALAGQVAWTVMSVNYDWSNSYSASADVAEYIKDHHLEAKRIDLMGKWGVGVLPYFSRDIFQNYNRGRGPSYFPWTTESPIPGRKSDVLLDNPDLILVAVKSREGQSRLACLPGYRELHAFRGGVYWPGGVMETESFALYQRSTLTSDSWFWGTCGLL
ncbi:MAG: hypothetical protein ABR564_00950 [Candidatus Dormibacteria bacterium]